MTKPKAFLLALSQNRDSASRVSFCYGLLIKRYPRAVSKVRFSKEPLGRPTRRRQGARKKRNKGRQGAMAPDRPKKRLSGRRLSLHRTEPAMRHSKRESIEEYRKDAPGLLIFIKRTGENGSRSSFAEGCAVAPSLNEAGFPLRRDHALNSGAGLFVGVGGLLRQRARFSLRAPRPCRCMSQGSAGGAAFLRRPGWRVS